MRVCARAYVRAYVRAHMRACERFWVGKDLRTVGKMYAYVAGRTAHAHTRMLRIIEGKERDTEVGACERSEILPQRLFP